MAYERSTINKIKGDGLDAFVENTLRNFSRQMASRNAKLETDFNQLVLDGDLSLDDQLNFRQKQLKEISDDPAERARVRSEISNLKERVQQKQYADEYVNKLNGFQSGVASIESLIGWLQSQKATTTNQTILNNINQSLSDAQAKKFELSKTILLNQTNYALKDQSVEVINNQITKVSAARAQALLSGNDEVVTSLDLQLQALRSAGQENSIARDIKTMAVSTLVGSSKAIDLLNAYNERITNSNTSTPLTINGIQYANAQEYWKFTRDSYLTDTGSSGFFDRINNETKTEIQVKTSNNTLSANDITNATSVYNQLYGRPELAGLTAKIDAAKQDTIQTAANALSDKIVNTYAQDYDLNKAVSAFNSLKNQGVNIDTGLSKVFSVASQIKTGNVADIVSRAQELITSNPALSVSAAVSQATKEGFGNNLSQQELLNTPPEQVATEVLSTNVNKTGVADQSQTISQPGQPAQPVQPATPAPATTIPGASQPGGSYLIKSGDTLSAIAAAHNTTVAALASANQIADPNRIQAGATLKIPTAPTQATPSPVTPTTPAPIITPQAQTPKPPIVSAPAAAPASPSPTPLSPSAGSGTYVIKYGDTLGAIAKAHGTTVQNLAKLNNIPDPNKIFAGKTLKLF